MTGEEASDDAADPSRNGFTHSTMASFSLSHSLSFDSATPFYSRFQRVAQTKEILSKQAIKIAKRAEEHERFLNKVTRLLGALGFGAFCFLLGARPHHIQYV